MLWFFFHSGIPVFEMYKSTNAFPNVPIAVLVKKRLDLLLFYIQVSFLIVYIFDSSKICFPPRHFKNRLNPVPYGFPPSWEPMLTHNSTPQTQQDRLYFLWSSIRFYCHKHAIYTSANLQSKPRKAHFATLWSLWIKQILLFVKKKLSMKFVVHLS